MKISSIKHHLKQGAKNVFKNRLMSFASISAVFACTFTLILSLCLVINLGKMLEGIEKTLGISIYLTDNVTEEECKELLALLENIDHVSQIDYLTKEDALNKAMEEFGEQREILEGFGDDHPFPRSFELTIDGAEYQEEIVANLEIIRDEFEKIVVEKRIENQQLMEDILESELAQDIIAEDDLEEDIGINIQDEESYMDSSEEITQNIDIIGEEYDGEKEDAELTQVKEDVPFEPLIGKYGYEYIGIEKIKNSQRESNFLLSLNNYIHISSIIIILILAIISVSIIMNTIKLTVFIRKNEINVMKYVGATDWFIRWPFVFEGIIIGLTGSLASIGLCFILYENIRKFAIENTAATITLIGSFEMFLVVIPTALLLGALIGIIGSITSIKKHLNV